MRKGEYKEDKRERKGSDGVETPSNKDGLTIEKEAEGEMGLKANGQKAKGLKAKGLKAKGLKAKGLKAR